MLNRLTTKWRGYRTKIAARCVTIIGGLVALYDIAVPYVMPVDWTPLSSHLPPWAWPLIVAGIGIMFAYLRYITTTPVNVPAGTIIVAPDTTEPTVLPLPPLAPVT